MPQGLSLNQEPSFLLLISSCILTIVVNGSNDIFNLFTLFCGCCTLSTMVCCQSRLTFMTKLLTSIVIFGILFDVLSLLFSLADWFDFIVIRLLVGVATAIAFEDFNSFFSASFTTGELCLVIQGLFSLIGISLVSTKSIIFNGDKYDISLQSQVIHFLSQKMFQLAVIIKFASLIDLSSGLIFPMALVSLLGGTYYFFWTHLLPEEPIMWLVKQATLTDTRVRLLIVWSVCLFATVAFSLSWTKYSRRKASSAERKLFHIPIFIVFITGIKEDINFLSFASACMLILFFLAECIRISKMSVISSFIDSVFDGFRDEKDSGPLTLTHLYLLIGCALPVWLSLGSSGSNILFAACSGVISIGLGDSAASICGSYLGKHKWPGSKKSYEGTAAAFVTQLIGSIVIFHYFYPHKTLQFAGFLVIAVTCLFVSLVEAFTREVDNLVLSLYFYNSLQVLSLLCDIFEQSPKLLTSE